MVIISDSLGGKEREKGGESRMGEQKEASLPKSFQFLVLQSREGSYKLL